ncbi:hypothetical protein E1A91_D01G119000v1 [Gossypium mustelinum]|uniref:Uncharacterized protein n=1 Tax=Gossypium mustelinum TaxID=34275 RepID=A0A5D2W648_GOSMU|nr:hypothetical protein E1A91_D01G119000v1 [Gossypium mustelinum]
MEAPITTMKAKSHARSNSLPSESHPVVAAVEDKLRRLRALEATSSSPSSLCKNLATLKMYEYDMKLVDDMLDGSLKLLDTCSSSKDALSQIKGCVRDFESSLRRKIRCKSSLVNEIREYFISRKQVNKIVCNCFGNMKRMQKSNATLVERDNDLVALASMLNEVEAVKLEEGLECGFRCLIKTRMSLLNLLNH